MEKNDLKSQVLSAIRYADYYQSAVEGLKPVGGGQALGICPFHGDTKNSFSVSLEAPGLWNCKGCGASGDIFTFHQRANNMDFKAALNDLAGKCGIEIGKKQPKPAKSGKKSQKAQRGTAPKKTPISIDIVDSCHKKLINTPDLLDRLKQLRGLTEEIIIKHRLGYHEKRSRITIPIFDEEGACRNIRMYSSTDEYKMISWGRGYGESMLYGLNELPSYPMDEPVLICEGEFDRLILLQGGFNAITHTNGADSFKSEWRELFRERHVVLCYDADDGGLVGTGKTSRTLAPVVASMKIIDLKDAGLVSGEGGDNDISDLARRRPDDWAAALRKAIDEAEPADLLALSPAQPPGPDPEDRFVRIWEDGGCYFKNVKNLPTTMSNFTLEPLRRIITEDYEILEARVAGDGFLYSATFQPQHWASRLLFKRRLGDLGAAFTGNDDDLQHLKAFLAAQSCPKCRAEKKIGFHQHKDKGWVLVGSDKSITASGEEISDLIYYNESSVPIKLNLGDRVDLPRETYESAAEAMGEFNAPDVVGAVIGFMTACPFRARLRVAVPSLNQQFPILLIWGERGAGKTKTAEALILPFYGQEEAPRKIDEMTKFTLMLSADATNLIPQVFDEYKPSKMKQRAVNETSNFLRSVYGAAVGERGTSVDGLGTRRYSYTAPVALIGEQTTASESALVDRIIEASFTKAGRRGRDIDRLITLPLASIGLEYILFCLKITDAEIRDVWSREFLALDGELSDRPRANTATLGLGLQIWAKFLAEKGAYFNPEPYIWSFIEAQKSAVFGDGTQQKNDVDNIIEAMSSFALMRNLPYKIVEKQDYRLDDTGSKLYLRLKTLYPKFKKWAREYEYDRDMLDELSFQKRLHQTEYFLGKSGVDMFVDDKAFSERSTKVWTLDINKMLEAGLDLSGFGISPIDTLAF